MKKHIVVIGGGMAGCAAAYSLRRQGYEVTIVERDDCLGGRMHSEKVGDLTFEMGAVFVTGFYKNLLAFLHETGLDKDLQPRDSESFVVRNGVQLSSKRLSTYFGSSWLSLGAKFRLIEEALRLIPTWSRLDAHAMWRAEAFDTRSVAERFSGKYGKELLSYLFEPVLNGYMYWSPERTSQAFLLILLKAAVKQRRVYILKHGLKQIPERAAEGCDVLLSHSVTSVRRKTGGEYVVDVKNLKNKRTLIADGIVCATTASVVPRIFSDLTSEQVDFFSSITYSSTAVAAYRVKRSQPTKTYAIAYPRIEKQPIAAMTVLSDVSPVANMIKIYASGSIGKEIIRKSDKEIHNIVTKPLSVDLMTALESGEWRIQRWMEAIPEFNVGHLRKLHSFANGEIETPDARVVFAGDYIGGPFMEGAFTSGIEAAARLHKQFDTI